MTSRADTIGTAPAPWIRPRQTDWPSYLLMMAATVAALVLVLIMQLGRPSHLWGGYAAQAAITTRQANAAAADIVPTLERQAKALVRGDEAGWLAPISPARADLLAVYRDHYRILRAFGVSVFRPVISTNTPTDYLSDAGPFVDTVVRFNYCTQTIRCPDFLLGYHELATAESFAARIRWVFDGKAYFIGGFELVPSGPDDWHRYQRAPWLETNLNTAVGARTTIAASALSGRLAAVLATAEPAALVADKYAAWVRPTHYIVYLASPAEWKAWLDGPTMSNDAVEWLGYEEVTSDSSAVVVLNMAAIDQDSTPLAEVLRHEFGHVVTLLGAGTRTRKSHLLTEGIAEYIQEDGRPISSYDGYASLRQFVRGGTWNGDIEQVEAGFNTDLRRTNLVYYMGYLTWRCIADTYGKDKLTAFAGSVLRTERTAELAAPPTLGRTWAEVKTGCATYIRAALR